MLPSRVRWGVLMMLWAAGAVAQHPVHRQWTQQDGLPTSPFYDIYQDAAGYLWLGSDKGLLRFDGRTVVPFVSTRMNGLAVSNITCDLNGVTRCQNFIGQVFRVSADSLALEERLTPSGNYAPIVLDAAGHIVSGSGQQVTFYDAASMTPVRTFRPEDQIASIRAFGESVYVLASHTAAELTGDGAVRSLPTEGLPIFVDLLLAKVRSLLYAFPRIATGGNVYRMLPQVRAIPLLPPETVVQSVNVTGDSIIWVGTTSGLYAFDSLLQPLPLAQPMFPGALVSGVIAAKGGGYWVSTLDRGIFQMSDLGKLMWGGDGGAFTVFGRGDRDLGLLLGRLDGSVARLDPQSPKSGILPYLPARARHRVVSIYRSEADGRTLVASDQLYTYIGQRPEAMMQGAVKDMVRTGLGSYLAAVTGSIRSVRISQGGLEDRSLDIPSSLFRSNALAVRLADSTVQMATSIGLWEAGGLGMGSVRQISEGILGTGLLWLGDTLLVTTPTQGILLLSDGKERGAVMLPGASKGELSGRMALYDGRAFLRSGPAMYSLSRGDTAPRHFPIPYTAHSSAISDFTVHDGRLFLCAGPTVISLPAQGSPAALPMPQVRIESVRVNDLPAVTAALGSLSHDRNSLQVHFSVPWFGDPTALVIRYRINGGLWQQAEPLSRIVSLPYLSPASYELEIEAMAHGLASAPPATVAFRVLAPLYARWWFILLGMAAFSMAGYGMYRYRMRLLTQQNSLLEEKLRLEQQLERSMLTAIRSQMNPHFIFNALNTIQSYIYLNDRPNAINYLGKFSSLTRLVLDMSNSDRVSLRDELDALRLYLELEKMRFEDSMEFSIEVSPDLSPDTVRIPSMLIQPYVENAVKHGLLHKKTDRRVSVSFYRKGDALMVTIDDNGVGRKRSAELNAIRRGKHRSFATEANRKRLDLLNKGSSDTIGVDFTDKTGEGGIALGTTVVLTIPMG